MTDKELHEETAKIFKQDYQGATEYKPEMDERLQSFFRDAEHENRIEALRAASRIVAGIRLQVVYSDQDTEALVVRMAEQFASWLESGER